jgi:hypothetical protein
LTVALGSRPDPIRAWPAALLAAVLVTLACAGSGPADRRTLRVRSSYTHAGSGIELPKNIGPLERERIRELRVDENDVAAYYMSGENAEPMHASVFISPAGQAFVGRLKQEFSQRLSEARRGGTRLKLLEARTRRAPDGTGRALGYEASFDSGTSERAVRTVLRVFQCGVWFLRLEVNAELKNAGLMDLVLERIHSAISCEAMADSAEPGSLEISIEPGMAARPEWRAYAEGQLEWLRANVSPRTLAVGLPDHDLALFVRAWNRALDAYSSRGDAPADPFFDAMAQIRAAGFLEEALWIQHLPFLTQRPIELDLESFLAWREQEGISPRYEIRAGAVLARTAPGPKP